MARPRGSASTRVAATGAWFDDEGPVRQRLPAGEVHGWEPGTNQTLCGLPLARAGLRGFSHVRWGDVQPASGGAADQVASVCARCAAAFGRPAPRWTRTDPRP